jgi:hypothetical protein
METVRLYREYGTPNINRPQAALHTAKKTMFPGAETEELLTGKNDQYNQHSSQPRKVIKPDGQHFLSLPQKLG